MRVVVLSSDLEVKYNAFVLRDSRSLIYASLKFRNFLVHAIGGEPTYLLALNNHNDIVGALGYFRYEAPRIGTVINSLPWYGSHGGCLLSDENRDEARTALLEFYKQEIQRPEIIATTTIVSHDEENFIDIYRSVLLPSSEDIRIGQVSQLPSRCEELENKIMQKTRNLVRKSLKKNFQLQIRDDDSAWQFLYETHVENMLAVSGRPKPWQHFISIRETFSTESRKLYLAMFDGVPVAALLLLYFNRTVEYITPVIKHGFRSDQPLSFLIWHAMQDAILSGYSQWNWGGTWESQKSLHHFKAGWGAVDCPYTYLTCTTDYGKATLTANRADLENIFPYFYTYPYRNL